MLFNFIWIDKIIWFAWYLLNLEDYFSQFILIYFRQIIFFRIIYICSSLMIRIVQILSGSYFVKEQLLSTDVYFLIFDWNYISSELILSKFWRFFYFIVFFYYYFYFLFYFIFLLILFYLTDFWESSPEFIALILNLN